MSTLLTSNTLDAIVAAAVLIHADIERAIGASGYQTDADALAAEAGVAALSTAGRAELLASLAARRTDLARIKDTGRLLMDPLIAQAAREVLSPSVEGNVLVDPKRAFIDINTDLLSGTPDYVAPRDVSYDSEPAGSSTGYFPRLTVDHNGEPIEDGFHNGKKLIQITSRPSTYDVLAEIRGESNIFGDELDYRAGRVARTVLPVVNDARPPVNTNPFLVPSDLTNDADVTAVSGWTLASGGTTPTFKVSTSVKWRGRSTSLYFKGGNTGYVELSQPISRAVFSDPYRPYLLVPYLRLTTGWEGTIDVTWGSKSQQFTHANLTNGAFVPLIPDRDKDLYPLNFDQTSPLWKIKLTNTKANTDNLYLACMLQVPLIQHEGLWYAHLSADGVPTALASVDYDDTCTFAGVIQDVLAFLYQDECPGFAHWPSSAAATITP